MRNGANPFTRLALTAVRVAGWLVPRRYRNEWRREWESEVVNHAHDMNVGAAPTWSQQMSLLRRSLGSLADAAWMRRQFTRDSELAHDVRNGVRLFRARPGVFGAAFIVLAIAIAAVSSSFTGLYHFVLAPLPFPDAERIVTVWESRPARGELNGDVSPANFLDWRSRLTSMSALAAAEPWSVDLTENGPPEAVNTTKVTAGFFELLGQSAQLGRTLIAADFEPGHEHVIVFSHAFWQRRFGGDPTVIGRRLTFDGSPHEVVGVLPISFDPGLLPTERGHDAWIPSVIPASTASIRSGGWWHVIGRVRPGRSIADAQAELDTLSASLAADHVAENKDMRGRLVPLAEHLRRETTQPAMILAISALVVLLVACGNVANLLMTVGLERQDELAVRAALGASRARLVRQLLVEGAMLASAAALFGTIAATELLQWFAPFVPRSIPNAATFGAGASTIAVAVASVFITVLIAGAVPALVATRASARLNLSGTRTIGASRGRVLLRDGFAIAEVALTLTLVASSALLYRSFWTLSRVDPGFSADGLVALQVFAYDGFATPAAQRQFFADTIDRLRSVNGVVSAAAVSTMPFTEADMDIRTPFLISGVPVDPKRRPASHIVLATPGFFETMKIPLLSGRTIAHSDSADSQPVMVISQSVARKFWGDANPLGAAVTVGWQGKTLKGARVIGVVGDIHHIDLDTPAREAVYVPFAQAGSGGMTFVVRTSGDPAALMKPLQEQVWALRPSQTIHDSAVVQQRIDKWLLPRRIALWMVGALGLLTLIVSATGIYGVISFSAESQSREMSVRLALGATPSHICRLVLRHGLIIATAGLAIGLAGAAIFAGALRQFLFGISAFDPIAIVGAAMLLGATALAASWIPAWRATRVSPTDALRT